MQLNKSLNFLSLMTSNSYRSFYLLLYSISFKFQLTAQLEHTEVQKCLPVHDVIQTVSVQQELLSVLFVK